MPSPFPGMDPWMEGSEIFPDLHHSLTIYLREAINAKLPPGYYATTKNLVWIDEVQRREPDISLFGRDRFIGDDGTAVATLPGMLALGEDRLPEPWEQPYLEIISNEGKRLVTAIEILSPANKTKSGNGRTTYLEKIDECRLGGVNVVEIDLLRGGLHTTAVPRARLERVARDFSYHVSVLVMGDRNRFFGVVLRLADRLPEISVPLDPSVPPVKVDLQPLLDRAYDTGRYAMLIDYSRPPDPPLTPEQQAWANAILNARGT